MLPIPSPPGSARSAAASSRSALRRALRGGLPIALGVFAAVFGVAACSSSEPSFDRSAAIETVIRDSGGHLTRAQAECYVDRVVGEIGSGALTTGSQPAPEYLPKLTRIRVDCTGVASLGTAVPSPVTTADASLGSRPQKPGDDPDLDALADACRATGAQPCDELFDKAAPGSQYEELGSTCGGRTKELSCAATYGPGGSNATATSTTAASVPSPVPPAPSTAVAVPTTKARTR